MLGPLRIHAHLRPALGLLGAIALGTGAACGNGPDSASRRNVRNVLLIVVDTLRADHLGMYGYARDTSPNIDAWFSDARVFERAYATEASTSPSVATILSGRLPQNHGVRLFYQLLPRDVPTLSDWLGEAGYQTAAVVSNAVLTDEAIGLAGRFDHYDDYVDERESRRRIWERNAERTTDAALRWLEEERDRGRPHFLWVHYVDPHGPYEPDERPRDFRHEGSQPFDTSRMLRFQVAPDVDDALEYVDRYDEEIAYCDREIGRLLDRYAELGLADEAVMVFTSDHGETMAEHEVWFTHSYHVYEAIARVPLAIRLPGAPPRRVRDPVSLADLAPTLLRLTGVDPPDGLDGRPLRRAGAEERPVFVEGTGFRGRVQRRAMVLGDHKFVAEVERPAGRILRRYRFDLARDPDEQHPLPWPEDGERPGRRLLRKIASDPDPGGYPRELRRGARLRGPKVHPEVDDEQLEKLRGLGYAP